jgi:tetratricopeptide (TPR) repeat protein
MRYVSLVFWPTPGRFSLEHDVELSTSLVSPPTTLLSIIALAAMLTWAVLKRKEHPLITYGIVWFFLNLLVESTFIPLEIMFEHRMYLPSIGLILSAVVALEYLARRALEDVNIDKLQAVPWCLFLILLSALTLATFDRNTVWEHPLALNADNAAKAPNNPRARSNHALALYRSGKYTEAIDEARIAMSVGVPGHEQYAVALNALISSYMAMGEYQTAIQEGERLLDDGPKRMNIVPLPYVHFSLGRAKQNLGDYQDAYMSMIQGLLILDRIPNVSADWRVLGIRLVEGLLDEVTGKGIDLDGDGDPDPGGTTPKAWLAETLLRHNQRHAARDLLHEAVALNPQDLYSKARLDEILAEDRLDEAQRQKKNFMDKYVRQPFSPFNLYMATSFVIKKNQLGSPWRELGESLLDRAGGVRPDSADVHLLRGWYHHDRGEAEKAVLAAREALKLDPDYANIWLGLGFFSMKANQPRQAMEAFQKSLELYPHAPSRSEILAILKGLEEASTGS